MVLTHTIASRELEIWAENTREFHEKSEEIILPMLRKGIYALELATVLIVSVMELAAAHYTKEFCTKGDKWSDIFTEDDLILAAANTAEYFKTEFELGNYK